MHGHAGDAWQSGQSQLLADEINDPGRNLSFEREFGKITGMLDLLSTDMQSLLGGTFLQLLAGR